MFSKFKKGKTVLGMEVKPRSKDDIDRDYIHNSVEIAHKLRVVHRLNEEIAGHVKKLDAISLEGEARQKADAPKAEELTHEEERA